MGTLTLTQDLPQQASRFVADGNARGVAFVGADPDITACGMTSGQWHCYSAQGYFGQAPAVLDYSDLLGVFETFRANQRWFSWTATSRDVAGQATSCAVGDATTLDAMAPGVRWIGYLLPLTYFTMISQGVMLRGASLASLWIPFAVLTVMAIVVFTGATLRFRRDLAPGRRRKAVEERHEHEAPTS